jgi:hypothetical protein
MPFKSPLFTKLTIAQQSFEERTPVDPETWQARTQRSVKYACHRTSLEETSIDTLCKETLFEVMKMRHITNHRQKDRLQSQHKAFCAEQNDQIYTASSRSIMMDIKVSN